ncbi:tetratricopeptide repeat protein [bacterium]|nr:tetratricopeptide repeat protein [bacterium]
MPQYTPHRVSFSPWLAISAAAVAILMYFSVIDNALLLEGRRLTADNPQMAAGSSFGQLWTRPTPDLPVMEGVPVYRPMLATLLRIERGGWGNSPSSFHSMNLILLIALIGLLLAWSGRLTRNVGATAAVAITMAVHPMAGQSVRTIEGQGILLALIAMIATMCVLNAWRSGRMNHWLAAVLIAIGSAVAFGAHELGLVLPLWMAAQWALARPEAATAPVKNGRGKKTAAPVGPREFRPAQLAIVFGPVALIAIGYAILRRVALGALIPAAPAGAAFPFGSAAALAIKRVVWPVQPTLVYSLNHDASFLPPMWLGWIAIALVVVLVVALWRRQPLASMGFAMAGVVVLGIGLGAPISKTFSEAPLAIALPGLCLAIGVLLRPVYEMRAGVALALAWVPLAAITWTAGARWHDAAALWQAEAVAHPGNVYPLMQWMDDIAHSEQPEKGLDVALRVKPLAKRTEDRDRAVEVEAAAYAITQRNEDLNKLLGDEIAAGGKHTPDHMLRLAQVARMRKLDDRVQGLLESELDAYPESFGALYGLADLARQKQNFMRAVRLIQKAIESAKKANDKKELAAGLTRYGIILSEAGALEGAAAQLKLALDADPQQYEAYIYLARVLRDQKNYDEAFQVINRCIGVMNLASYVDLAKLAVSILSAQHSPDLAAQWLLQLVPKYPNDFELNLFAAHYMVEVRRFKEARTLASRLYPLAKGPALVEVWNIGAFCAFAERDYNTAESLTRRVLKEVPNHPEATQLLPLIEAAKRRAAQK